MNPLDNLKNRESFKLSSRRGSSLVFLGFSILIFIISYGVVWLLVPQILGAFFTALPALSGSWGALNTQVQTEIRWLIPLSISMGIFVLVIKVLMVASVKGSD